MKYFYFFIISFFLGGFISIHSQEVHIQGKVKDSLGNPLAFANVILVNSESNSMEGFSISNENGEYKTPIYENSKYLLKVTLLGFEPIEVFIQTSTSSIQKNIILKEKAVSLEEVELVYEIPVKIKGDTIVYKTDAFVSGTEKKLGDVLKKLPGIEVNEDGEIEAEGKKVGKVMVEGKDFFDGDSKLAVKNIPADALDKIEVLRNYNEVSQIRDVTNNQDNVSLNILLKEGKKDFWFGEVTAGSDLDNLYIIHPSLFYYSPKYSINIISDLNNIGEVPFTVKDYLNFTGGLRNLNLNSGTLFNPTSNELGISLLQNNRAKEIDTKFGALNFSYSPIKNWDISGFSIYSFNETTLESFSNRTYTSTNFTETTSSLSNQELSLGLLKLSSTYKPNTNFQLDFDSFLKLSDQEENNFLETITNVTDTIQQFNKQKPLSIKNNLNAYFTVMDKNIFALELQHLYQNEDPLYSLSRSIQPFASIIPIDRSQSSFKLSQERFVKTEKIDGKLDYFLITSPKSSINFTIGTILSNQKFDSSLFQTLDDSSVLSFTEDNLNNDVSFSFSDVFLGLHYKFLFGKFTFTPGMSFHSYSTINSQLDTKVSDNLSNIAPDLFINYQIKQSENVRLNYAVNREFTDINNLFEGYVLNNYNSIYQGNRNLESALYHKISLNYTSFNMFNFQNIFVNLSYNKRIDPFKGSNSIIGINQVNSRVNSNFSDEIYSGLFNFQRSFKKIKTNLGSRIYYSNFYNIVNETPILSKNFTQNYKISFTTTFQKTPNFEVGYNYTVNNYDNGGMNSTFYTNSPFIKFDAAFWDGFNFKIDYDYNNYSDKDNTISNEFSFINSSLSYQKPESNWEYSLQATNLLDNSGINQDTFNEIFFTTSFYKVQPRYIYFKITYNL